MNISVCALGPHTVILINNTFAYVNEVMVAVVNAPMCVFAFLSNLAIIISVAKTPSLQIRSTVLLCSLAFTDCLTGLIVQPLFIAWRLMLHKSQLSCNTDLAIFPVQLRSMQYIIGISFIVLTVISFDRQHAISRPLLYRATATSKGALKTVVGAGILWTLYIALGQLLPPGLVPLILDFIVGGVIVVTVIVNHIRMYLAVRKQRIEVTAEGLAQQKEVFHREKKVALSGSIITALVVFSVIPPIAVIATQNKYPYISPYLYPWTLTVAILTSSFNPIIFLKRNHNLRIVVKEIFGKLCNQA